ncbi:MAG: GAF domain-containing protein [Persicimonas sp.]
MVHRQAGRSPELPSGADLSPEQLLDGFERQLAQQSAAASLSRLALSAGADEFVARAVEAVRDGLHADSARVLELVGGDQFCLRAAAGLQHRPGPNTTVYADARTSPGIALRDDDVYSVDDFDDHDSLRRLPLFDTPERVSAIEAPIPGPDHPVGVLGAGCRSAYVFTAADAAFTRTVAHLIGAVLMRARSDDELHRAMTARQQALEMLSHDLRSPASAIKLSLEVVRRAVTGDAQPIAPELVERAITKANSNLDRMLDILDARLEIDERQLDEQRPSGHDRPPSI